jgi:lipopolysaccharide transport system permease protein
VIESILQPFRLLWSNRRALAQTTGTYIRARYAGSVIGVAWLVLYPLLFLACYAVIYVYIFKVRPTLLSAEEYVLLIFCGLIPFLAFSESIGIGTGSVVSNAHLVKNTLFPIELFPVQGALASQSMQVVGFVLLLAAVALVGRLTPWVALLPVVWVLQLLFTTGLLWILASTNALLRDLQSVVPVVLLLLMMVSPIAYTEDMVPAGLQTLLKLNPLAYIILAYQDILFRGRLPRPHILFGLPLISLGVFLVGYWYFNRLKGVLADHV